ncbi:hypothetical protein KDW40_09610 [Burkholderia cenocepacia]|uniref:hypothetical protein n=1 Tax=Burkholderia cepacia complex TaxID=87882 RepID=UPI001B9E51DE|nr:MULTISPECIES: hypothetical protein [Burkholderia cepacia complex]MBR8040715.1 hypothetical protein [Burkholderia cenocepacia]MBR8325988.1 hypothetical protein [Burkholderia cenocepacia]MCA8407724.1 hypothetical protein [Burkholderia cenocepacia]MDN7584308.1 hypothetical protein [Burkholderia orbicola]MDS0850621.1 hypothetical protein [Burkholderia cenocepacia]
MLGAVLAALEPDTPTLRPLFGKAVPDVASRRLDAPRRAKIEAWRDLTEGADFLVI